MLDIIVNGKSLDLPENTTFDIEDTNPIFNDRGSQSLPITVPPTSGNRATLEFPDLLYSYSAECQCGKEAVVVSKSYMRRGIINITSASRSEGISFNIGFDNSTVYETWQNKKLRDLKGLPVIEKPVPELLEWLRSRMPNRQPEDEGLVLFPIILSKHEYHTADSNDKKYIYDELNSSSARYNFDGKMKFKQVINNNLTQVSAPAGYAVSPFLKVWRLLELAFADLGVTINENPMKDNPELARVTVLNNTMDGVATGRLDYADIMPDCTVADLMNALWVRFGLTYVVNFDTSTVRLRLIKDVLTDKPRHDFDAEISDFEVITYESPKYLMLSASTSIEGAKPPCSRYEDFIKDEHRVLAGANVEEWLKDDAGVWLRGGVSTTEVLGCEIITGKWYRIDTENLHCRKSGSSFFNWDPKPDQCEALELRSVDECVPIDYIEYNNEQDIVAGYYPMYLCGAKHLHSIIKGAIPDDDEEDEKTPLAFLLSFELGESHTSVGRNSMEGIDPAEILGVKPTFTLYFQFEDGLFATFWREYDEVLRHANRIVEVPTRLPLNRLRSIDLLEPVRLKCVPCLVDTFGYSLPVDINAAVDVKLRTILPQGVYDLAAEQQTAQLNFSQFRLSWQLIHTNIESYLSLFSAEEVIASYKRTYDYKDHWDEDHKYYYFLDPKKSVTYVRYKSDDWEKNLPERTPYPDFVAGCPKTVGKSFHVTVLFNIRQVKTSNPDYGPYELVSVPYGDEFGMSKHNMFLAVYAPILMRN